MARPARPGSLGELSDNRLIRRTETLRAREREVLMELLRHIGEIERRQLYLPRGYSSLFEFCTQHLKYSRSAAGRRIAASRAMTGFPALAGYLVRGEVNLHSLAQISGILTRENFREIITGIKNRPTREVDAFVAQYRPDRILRDRVRPVCVMQTGKDTSLSGDSDAGGRSGADITPGAGSRSAGTSSAGSRSAGTSSAGSSSAGSNPAGDVAARSTITPGAGSGKSPSPLFGNGDVDSLERVRISRKYRIEFAVDPGFMKKIERLRSMLSGRFPKGISFEEMFMVLIDEYIERHSPEGRAARREKRRSTAANDRNRSDSDGDGGKRSGKNGNGRKRSDSDDNNGSCDPPGRNIPRKIRDEVFLRDGGRCTFVGTDGRRCNSKWHIQLDHIVPFALGGDNSPGNLRLLCGKHNRLEAERVFGHDHMKRFRKRE